jgi:hypothetical protein
MLPIDPEVYVSELGGQWPNVDAATIGRLSTVGYLLRRIVAIDWKSVHLELEEPSTAVTSMQLWQRDVTRGLEQAAEWLT